ncbi:MAG: hypothetical protein CMF60_05280 [Magnetococcales bacterium]|nr:hypothetical protein [Magnetococcales bacterium]
MLITPDILTIFNSLKPYECRLVGGCVRDYLYNKTISEDIDIATTATPQTVMDLLKNAGMHVVPTGLKHGTVTCVYRNKPYEITTLRRDIETNGRHATVTFTDNFYEDSLRRDFTFNALYMDHNQNVTDFHGGLNDLQHKKIKFIGHAKHRIEEDYLRILRYFRFHGKFEEPANFNDNDLKVISSQATHLQQLSIERVTMEVVKILKGHHSLEIWQKMAETQVLKNLNLPINPALQNIGSGALANLPWQARAYISTGDMDLFIKSLRLPNVEQKQMKQIQKAVTRYNNQHDLYQQAYWLGHQNLILALKILAITENNPSHKQLAQNLQNWECPTFPLTGKDLIKAGFKPSPQLGQILQKIETEWVAHNFPPQKWCIDQIPQGDK